jgi:hypothetical protein
MFRFLFVFCLVVCAYRTICAQTQEPISLGGKALDLPDNWTEYYEPPQVVFKAQLNADSTLTLISITDGKNELLPFLKEHLSIYKYILPNIPMQVDNEREFILAIYQKQKEQNTEKEAADNNLEATIDAWISLQKELSALGEVSLTSSDRNYHPYSPEPYLAMPFAYARSYDAGSPTFNQFTLQDSYLNSSTYQEQYGLFHALQNSPYGLNYIEADYPYPVLMSDIQAGLGDYEHRYAKGSLKKNGLFGVIGLYSGFDFLLGSGRWLEHDAPLSDLRGFVRIPIAKTELELEIETSKAQRSMLQLRPEYWQASSFSFTHKYLHYSARWENKWLNIAAMGSNETASSDLFLNTLTRSSLQVMADKTIILGPLSISGLYTHDFAAQTTALTSNTFADLAKLDLFYQRQRWSANTQIASFDFNRFQLSGLLSYAWNNFALQPFAYFNLDNTDPVISILSIYAEDDWIFRADIHNKHDIGIAFKLTPDQNRFLRLAVGQRLVSDTFNLPIPKDGSPNPKANVTVENSVFYCSLEGSWNQSWGKWSLYGKPGFRWQVGIENLVEEPDWEGSLRLELNRDLNYGNSLFAGIDLIGHGTDLSSDQSAFVADPSLIADLKLGVRITERFDLTAYYRNALDSTLYGAYPIAPSLHAEVRWIFLN